MKNTIMSQNETNESVENISQHDKNKIKKL